MEVTLLTAAWGDKESSLWIRPRKNNASFKKRLVFEILSGLELFFRVLFSRYNLYYFSTPNYFTVFIGAFACALTGKKYVLDVRDIYPESFFKLKMIKENSLIGQMSMKFTSYIYDKAAQIITVTPSLVEMIKEHKASTPIELIPNGYEASLFKPSTEKYEHFTCVIHGTLGVYQNVELLVEVAEKLQSSDESIKLLVIGFGPKNHLIKDATHLKNIIFHGQTDYNKLPELVSKAHIGLSFRGDDETSLGSFPVKVFEYIGMDLPIISTTNNEASKAVVKYDIGAYFENKQVEEIVNEIIKYKNDPELIKKKISNIQKIKHLYSREEQAKEFAKILTKA